MQKRTITNQQLAGCNPWCIAGGYAACPALASDMDVWIYGLHKDVLEPVRGGMLQLFPEIEPENNPPRDSPEAYLGVRYTLKVGRLGDRHILVTSAVDVDDLLDGFDISTHACALTSDGRFVKSRNWTPIWEPPRMIFEGGANTPLRMKKLTERYQFLYHSEPTRV